MRQMDDRNSSDSGLPWWDKTGKLRNYEENQKDICHGEGRQGIVNSQQQCNQDQKEGARDIQICQVGKNLKLGVIDEDHRV